MNKAVLLNLCWVAIAAAAFVIGRATVSTTSQDDGPQASHPTKGGSLPTRSSVGGSGDGSGSRAAGTSGRLASSGSGPRSGVTVQQFLNESDPLVANKMFADLLLELDPERAKEVFAELLANRVEPQQLGLFLQAWGKLDGAAAMSAVAEMEGDGRRRAMASLAAMSGWAAVDPEAAKAHVETVENGWERAMLVQGIVDGLARLNPGDATNYVLQLEAEQRARAEAGEGEEGGRDDRRRGFAFDRQIDTIANEQIRRGMDVATAWAEELPDGDIKSSAFDRVAENYAREDPAAAAEWIKQHADSEFADRGVREVAEELAREDPAAAAAWVSELPAERQSTAMRETMERWTREDPVAAGEYLTAMPRSEIRDSAVSSFARELDREQPEIAVQWAHSIGNAELRTDTLHSVARSWVRSNPEAAAQWLPSSGLPPEVQQDILRDAQNDRDRRNRWRGP